MTHRGKIEKVVKFSAAMGVVHFDDKRHNLREKSVGPSFEVGDEVEIDEIGRHGAFLDPHQWRWVDPAKVAAQEEAEHARGEAAAAVSAERERKAEDPENARWVAWMSEEIDRRAPAAARADVESALALRGAARSLYEVDRGGPTSCIFGRPIPPNAKHCRKLDELHQQCHAVLHAWLIGLPFEGRVRYAEAIVEQPRDDDRPPIHEVSGILRTTSLEELDELGVRLGPALAALAQQSPEFVAKVLDACPIAGSDTFDLALADLEITTPRFVPLLTFDEVDWMGLYVHPPSRATDAPDPVVEWDHETRGVDWRAASFDDQLQEYLVDTIYDFENMNPAYARDDDAQRLEDAKGVERWLDENGSPSKDDAVGAEISYASIYAHEGAEGLDPKQTASWLAGAAQELQRADVESQRLQQLELEWCAHWHLQRDEGNRELQRDMLEQARVMYDKLNWRYPHRVVEAALAEHRLTR